MQNLTVVVTNYRRPEFLDRCLSSLIAAGVARVVVSTASPDWAVTEVLAQHKTKFREFQVVSTADDFGCNETWLRGVYYARTPYVLILHDDDFLEPAFGQIYTKIIRPQLDRGVGFASWRGQSVRQSDGFTRPEDYFSGPTRVLSSGALSKRLLVPGSLTISPVLSVFRRTDVIRILKEAAQSLRDPACFTRPMMMVGNDLLLYLRHAEKYASWLYVDKILTNFGAWEGSETVQGCAKKNNPLVPAYDYARKVFLSTRGPAVELKTPRLIHVYSEYPVTDPDTTRRHNVALKTWEYQYSQGNMLPFPITDADLGRSSKDLGDKKGTPFIKDMLAHGLQFAAPGDRVVLTNRDTCLVRCASDVLSSFPTQAAYGPRRDFFAPIHETAAVFSDISTVGTPHCGADLVMMTPEWWRKWADWLPDLLLGYETWDLMVREVFTETQKDGPLPEIRNIVYHEYHSPFWSQPENRFSFPPQVYALRQTKNWYATRGRVDMCDVIPVPEG